MAKRNNTILWIAIVLVGAYLVFPGAFAGLGLSAIGDDSGETVGQGTCGDQGQRTLVGVTNPLDDQGDRVATTAYLIQMDGGDENLLGTITTSATTNVNFTERVDCQSDYKLLAGTAGASGFYFTSFDSADTIANKQTKSHKFDIAGDVGTVTATVRTDTNNTYAAATILTLGAGESGTVTLRLKENTADSIYGLDGYIGVCVSHSTTNMTASTIENMASEEFPVPSVITADSGEAYNCYKVKADLQDFSVKEIVIGVHAGSGLNPTTEASSQLDITVLDFGNQLRDDVIVNGFTDVDNSATDLMGTNVALSEGILVR